MKRLFLSVVLSAALASPAAADAIDVLYKNTLTLTDAQGRTTTMVVSEGGRLEQINGSGMWAAGFWTKDGDTFCWTARGESQVCIPLVADKRVGDTWEILGPSGHGAWVAKLIPGRADLRMLSKGPGPVQDDGSGFH